jgi:hypothetical protein
MESGSVSPLAVFLPLLDEPRIGLPPLVLAERIGNEDLIHGGTVQ